MAAEPSSHSAVAEEPHSAVAEEPMEEERNLQRRKNLLFLRGLRDFRCSGSCLPTCPTILSHMYGMCGHCECCDTLLERIADRHSHKRLEDDANAACEEDRHYELTRGGGAFGDYQPPDGNGEGPRAVESDPRARNVVLKEAREKLKRLVVDTERVEAVTAVMKLLNEYGSSPFPFIQLGQGYKTGGFEEHQNKRFDLLDRVRSVAALSPTQANQWVAFRTAWDKKMAAEHRENWCFIFYDIAMSLLAELVSLKCAISDFMEREKMRWCMDLSPEGHHLPHC